MNAQFGPAITFVLQHEGGYSNDPNDPGGETNFGISKRSYPDVDIKNLTREQAIAIYERDYWKFGELSSQRLANKMLDVYVNLPPSAAIRLLQSALAHVQAGPVVVDGKLGPLTIAHANAADEEKLIDELKFQLVRYYYQNTIDLPRDAVFRDGWWRRSVKG